MRHRERYWKRLLLGWAVVSMMIVTFLFVALPTDSANAFNGKRKGFILGGGIGPAYATVDNVSRYRSRAETFGVQTAFIIGGGVSDQVTISYTGLQFWGNFRGDEVGFALLPSVEVRYFLSPDAPSTFGTLGLGVAVYDDNSGEWEIGGGFSPHLGFGYEFARHFSAEVDVVYTFSPEPGHEPLFNIMLVFTVLGY
jgi:hypothetical protein